MTLARVKEALRNELWLGYVMGNSDDALLLSGVTEGNEARANKLYKAANAAINRLALRKRGRLFSDAGEDDQAYFVLMEMQ
jgi:sugar/nucleoside kinase (ribokinase family)